MKKIIGLIGKGIMMGCTISCLVCIVGVAMIGNEWFISSPRSYILQIVAAMVVGIGWVVPSIVYESEKLSYGIKILIHMTIGLIVYIPCAIYMKWLPLEGGIIAVILELLAVIAIAFIIWLGFFLYYRKEATNMNDKIKKMPK